MQTLRKKTSPLKYKNETTRFLGDGVSFKAKLIGILEVSEARGDRMCQEALSDLKMAIRAAGEHKQRIIINVAIDGLRLRDEKTGDSLYHHPVHKISFIAQDMTDSRAFGYIFGSPDTGHRFFGIKTDKAASQVVIAMRDLFQVVFALKKKEIELAKQHLEKSYLPSSPLFPDSSTSGAKSGQSASEKLKSEPKSSSAATAGSDQQKSASGSTAVADLVDLELELNSLQQGLNQMERITPSDPFSGAKDDPFGDSFVSFPTSKPILPPPPSSGRERSRQTSDSGSLFSPKTPHTGGSETTNTDSLLSASRGHKKDFSFSHDFSSSHEEPSSGDWFTPSGGNSMFEDPPLVAPEPTKDEKHEQTKKEILSQFDVFTELDPLELKNPPKKALKELVSTSQPQESPLFNASFVQPTRPKSTTIYTNTASVFTSDPFGEDPFVKEDPFANSDFAKQDPFDTEFANFPTGATLNSSDKKDNLQSLMSRSPKSSMLDKQMSLNPSPKTVQFSKQNTFDVPFEDKKLNKLAQLHESGSLDVSSESECAPEPPPRPAVALMQIKPPPLPPKKQNDLSIKPPPRPPHTEDSHYDYVDHYETAPTSIHYSKSLDNSPPLPVPSRKSKLDNDFSIPPERPKKQFNLQSSEEDYLTPISFPDKPSSPTVLLPPPQRSGKKQQTVASSALPDNLTSNLEGLDITLSQLTLSGLNELASKLNIPSSQLSNMTLVQLTSYLSNIIKSKSQQQQTEQSTTTTEEFQPDFAANFNDTTTKDTSYDRYAVFRELQEEIKQTKIDTEPEQIQEEKEMVESAVNTEVSVEEESVVQEVTSAEDKYAALREIVEIELKQPKETEETVNEEDRVREESKPDIEEINMANREKLEEILPKSCIIEYADNKEKLTTPTKSPVKSPVRPVIVKSPIPSQVTDVIQASTRLTSGSLSDVISGSSPEVDHTGSNSDVGKKSADATGESWAIFDQAAIPPPETPKEKQAVQSEEGVSPWSSDSKEFGNGGGSPASDWRKDSGSDQWTKRRRDQQDGWWDTSAEPEAPCYPTNRRSTDSYDEEYYECYDRPRRRRQGNWQQSGGGGGGHSSSSRDVSPWEEEPRRSKPGWRHAGGSRGHGPPFDGGRHRERRRTDSWDEEDDYEYDEEQDTRFRWSDRHLTAAERVERHGGSGGTREHEWVPEEWSEDRRYRRRREGPGGGSRERWCCPDWEQDKPPISRYAPPPGRQRAPPPSRYYGDRGESPWEEEEGEEREEPLPPPPTIAAHYAPKRGGWRQRPSSASETDRKEAVGRGRHFLGGSDGERDRRYKPTRRSRSRDSQYSDVTSLPHYRSHKAEPLSLTRSAPTRAGRPHGHPVKTAVPMTELPPPTESERAGTVGRKKKEATPKGGEEKGVSTLPRKGQKSEYSGGGEESRRLGMKFNFNNEFIASEKTSPTITRPLRQQSTPLERERHRETVKESKLSARYYSSKTKSLFEDDFSPTEKLEQPEDTPPNISSIKEETDQHEEEEDEFGANNFENATNGRKKILAKNRLSGARTEAHLKKSESINIFARENDPFDDDFFFGEASEEKMSPKNTELRWTDDFE